MNKQVTIDDKTFTIGHFTVKQRMDLQDEKDIMKHYLKSLEYSAGLSAEEVLALDGHVADELFVEIIEYNKPPLELLKRLQPPSTPTTIV